MTTSDLGKLAVEAVLAESNHIVIVVDSDMIVRWAGASASQYGFDPVGMSFAELIHPEDLDRAKASFQVANVLATAGTSLMANSIVSFRVMTPSGIIPCDASGRWVIDDADNRCWLVAVLREVRTRFAVDRALKILATGASEQQSIEVVIDAAHVYGGVVAAQLLWSSGDGRTQTAGDLGTEIGQVVASLGTPDSWPTVLTPLPVGVQGSAWGFSAPVLSEDVAVGSIAVWGKGPMPSIEFARTTIEPVTELASLAIERVRRHVELERRATTDLLTGLLNRHAFFTELEQTGPFTAVMYVDLDGFKAVNDEFGHTIGDRLLSVVGKRLVEAVGENDVIGRVGGDEFAILCRSTTWELADRAGDRIVESLAQTFSIDGNRITTGASVGVAFSEQPIDGRVMLDQADRALLAAKSEGKGRSSFLVVA